MRVREIGMAIHRDGEYGIRRRYFNKRFGVTFTVSLLAEFICQHGYICFNGRPIKFWKFLIQSNGEGLRYDCPTWESFKAVLEPGIWMYIREPSGQVIATKVVEGYAVVTIAMYLIKREMDAFRRIDNGIFRPRNHYHYSLH